MSASELVAAERGLRVIDSLMAGGFTRDMNGTDSDAPGSRKTVRLMRNAMRFKAAPGSEDEYVTIPSKEMTMPLWRANEMVLQGMGYILTDDSAGMAPETPVTDPEKASMVPDPGLESRVEGLESKMDRILAILESK